MKRAHAFAAFLTTLLVVSFSAGARAAPIELTAAPILGAESPAPPGWFGYTVRVRGTGSGMVQGTVEITNGEGGAPRARFAVRPQDQVVLELYAHDVFSESLEAVARDDSGDVIAKVNVENSRTEAPLLFDAGGSGKLAVALRDLKIATRVPPQAWAPPEGLTISVTRANTDPRSGDPILPERAMGYGAATVVLMRTELLVGLPEHSAQALADWVLSGGTLALAVGRPEDLSHPRLQRWIGEGVRMTRSKAAADETTFEIVLEPSPSASEPIYGTKQALPTAGILPYLSVYSGGKVTKSRYGALARHGLGAVHLLSFDPNAEALIDDPWVRSTMVDLLRVAWDEHAVVGLVGSATGFAEHRLETARRHLDPNESGRWSVVVAAALLVIYAVVAGPLSFRRAAKSKNPLRALFELPLWSLGALFLVVGIGAVSKGGRARARRLEVLECGSGAERCAALRLRAFFASSADALDVQATQPDALLEVVGEDRGVTRSLVMEQGKARLQDLRGRPWETILVREDGFEDLGGSIALKPVGRDFRLTNGTKRALVAVIARAANGDLISFARIAPGASVLGSKGDVFASMPPKAPAVAVPGSSPSLIEEPQRLEAYRFTERANSLSSGAGAAWEALEYAAADNVDWWPERPVALAEIEGGSGAQQDSELRVDKDRRLVRVIGETAGEPWEGAAP